MSKSKSTPNPMRCCWCGRRIRVGSGVAEGDGPNHLRKWRFLVLCNHCFEAIYRLELSIEREYPRPTERRPRSSR